MNIISLRLQHFRNLEEISLDLNYKRVGFLGENAQGKTNILEGLYVLSRGESWRATFESDLISHDSPFARVDGTLITDTDPTDLAILIERNVERSGVKKTYLVNDIKRKKETFTRHFPVILFSPEDISLVAGTPAARRKALDLCLCESFPHYSHLISQYGKIVVSRNRLLERIREGQAHVNQLEYWTQSMIQLGSQIYHYRYLFFNFLINNQQDYLISYAPKIWCVDLPSSDLFIQNIAMLYAERVQANIEKEIMSATSQYGPHKDDYTFFLDKKDLSLFGSRGEQRAALFFYKKMQLLYIESARLMKPVLLLDDIFSEFDKTHRHELALMTQGYQTFVTGTEEEFFMNEGFGFDRVFEIKKGEAFVK
ncbi:MAG: DNA replication and repair protein RecF [bacterium]|nr:DNA replication and repair protein RecF [bacterium]